VGESLGSGFFALIALDFELSRLGRGESRVVESLNVVGIIGRCAVVFLAVDFLPFVFQIEEHVIIFDGVW